MRQYDADDDLALERHLIPPKPNSRARHRFHVWAMEDLTVADRFLLTGLYPAVQRHEQRGDRGEVPPGRSRRTDADELAAPWSGGPGSQICEATAFLGLRRNQYETISPLK